MFGVEPICRVLTEHGTKIAPSTYYAVKSRPASARAVRDERLKTEITRIFVDNYQVYGARKILGWRTPAEVLEEQLRSSQQASVAATG
ncbi:hypothetical protein ACGFNU_44220 [Spirillospora sp. NPDC048911]|uniref:hypothetical protein n=1 Tax=Spirillospora sp. NPDC048911 TaxID=3364527 RepID=UPI003719D984